MEKRTVKFVVTFENGIPDGLLKTYTKYCKEQLKVGALDILADYTESDEERDALEAIEPPHVSIVKVAPGK